MDMRKARTCPYVPDRKIGSRIIHLSDLPPVGFRGRWTYNRKAAVILCCRHGLITVTEILDRYGIAPEEYESWSRGLARLGVKGCKAATLPHTRDSVMTVEVLSPRPRGE
jgi:Protein of unknown function (DUF1153)